MIGTVEKVYPTKGYAFIRGADKIVRFAHASDFAQRVHFDLVEAGTPVEFTPTTTSKGERATNVIKPAT